MNESMLPVVQEAAVLLAQCSHNAAIHMEVGGGFGYHVRISPSGVNRFSARIEQVDHIPLLRTCPVSTCLVDEYDADALADITTMLSERLRTLGVGDTSSSRLVYTLDPFAQVRLTPDRRGRERWVRVKQLFGTADTELLAFVSKSVLDAMKNTAAELDAPDKSISFRFYPDPQDISAIYFKMRSRKGRLTIDVEDRVVYPWVQSRLSCTDASHAARQIAAFLSKHHAFAFNWLRMYVAYIVHEAPEYVR